MSGIWRPAAAERPDIWTATVSGSFAATNTITITIGNRALVITLGTNTAASTTIVADVIKRALVADSAYDNLYGDERKTFGGRSVGEFAELRDVTVSGSVVTIYGKPGVPITLGITETASGSVTVSQVQTATGPRFWDNVLNWSDGAVPVGGDDLIFADASVGPSFGLPTSLAADNITAFASFTGWIGLPYTNRENSSLPYTEYRQRHAGMATSGTTDVWEFGVGDGRGSRFIYITNSGTADSPDRITIRRTAEPLEGNNHAIYLANHPSIATPPYNEPAYVDVLQVDGGFVGLGVDPVLANPQFQMKQMRINGDTARVVCGANTVFYNQSTDEMHIANGQLDVYTSDLQTFKWRQTGGLVRLFGDPTAMSIDDYYVEGGRTRLMREATIDDLIINGPGIFDLSSSTGAVTVTNKVTLNATSGGLIDPMGRTRGNDIQVKQRGMGQATDLGNSFEITPISI